MKQDAFEKGQQIKQKIDEIDSEICFLQDNIAFIKGCEKVEFRVTAFPPTCDDDDDQSPTWTKKPGPEVRYYGTSKKTVLALISKEIKNYQVEVKGLEKEFDEL